MQSGRQVEVSTGEEDRSLGAPGPYNCATAPSPLLSCLEQQSRHIRGCRLRMRKNCRRHLLLAAAAVLAGCASTPPPAPARKPAPARPAPSPSPAPAQAPAPPALPQPAAFMRPAEGRRWPASRAKPTRACTSAARRATRCWARRMAGSSSSAAAAANCADDRRRGQNSGALFAHRTRRSRCREQVLMQHPDVFRRLQPAVATSLSPPAISGPPRSWTSPLPARGARTKLPFACVMRAESSPPYSTWLC